MDSTKQHGMPEYVVKALILARPTRPRAPGGEIGAVFASLGALEPPYDPEVPKAQDAKRETLGTKPKTKRPKTCQTHLPPIQNIPKSTRLGAQLLDVFLPSALPAAHPVVATRKELPSERKR